ncbi:hypothetical protein MG293_000714, partial [Ovis ammon polii]
MNKFPSWVVPSTCDNPEDGNAPDEDVTGYSRILNGASSTFHCSGHDTKEDGRDDGDLLDREIKPGSSALQANSLPSDSPGKPPMDISPRVAFRIMVRASRIHIFIPIFFIQEFPGPNLLLPPLNNLSVDGNFRRLIISPQTFLPPNHLGEFANYLLDHSDLSIFISVDSLEHKSPEFTFLRRLLRPSQKEENSENHVLPHVTQVFQ